MKTIIILLFPITVFCQSKDYSKNEILKKNVVIKLATTYNVKTIDIYNSLKCQKEETKTKFFKNLPLFSGKYPSIKTLKDQSKNEELWILTAEQCKEKYILKNI